jgi:hypothetical protein
LLLQGGVPALTAQQANLNKIDIGTLAVGPIAVGSLVIDNTDFAMNAAQAILRNLSVTLGLNLKIKWSIDVELFSDSGTEDLGTVEFDVPLPDLTLAPLNNISVNIPTLTAQNASGQADPLSLSVSNATADQIRASNTVLPTAGFTVAGLSVTSIEGEQIDVPAVGIDSATVAHLHGDPIVIPNFTLRNLTLPAAQSPSITNTAPLVMPLALGPLRPAPGIDIGILSVALLITPIVTTHVGHLEITSVTASATVGQISLRDVTLPYDVLNLRLSQLGINSVAIPSFAVS